MNLTLYEKYRLDYLTTDGLNIDRFIEEIISYFSIYEILLTVDCALIIFLFIWLWRKDKYLQNDGATLRQQLLLSAQRALWGEFSPNIRAVAIGCNDKNLHLIYYLDNRPSEDDYESISNVAGEIISDFPSGTFVSSKEKCIKSIEPINELNALDGWVYIRKERSTQ